MIIWRKRKSHYENAKNIHINVVNELDYKFIVKCQPKFPNNAHSLTHKVTTSDKKCSPKLAYLVTLIRLLSYSSTMSKVETGSTRDRVWQHWLIATRQTRPTRDATKPTLSTNACRLLIALFLKPQLYFETILFIEIEPCEFSLRLIFVRDLKCYNLDVKVDWGALVLLFFCLAT